MSVTMAVPDWVAPLLLRLGGINPHGQPNYRIVWSEDRLEWFFGEQVRKYGNGRDRWILEKWCPPGESEQVWAEMFEQALGPFPREGSYETSWACEVRVNADEEPSFMPLSENVLEVVVRAIEAGKLQHTAAERQAALAQREERIKTERSRIFNDIWKDSAPAPGAKIPEHIEMMDSFNQKTTADLNPSLPTRGFKQIGEN